MERIGEHLSHRLKDLEQQAAVVRQAVLADPDIAAFITEHQLDGSTIEKSLSKFHQYRQERSKFINQAPDYTLKGYEPVLVMNEGYADVSYRETPAFADYQAQLETKRRVQLINLPKSYKDITFDDVFLDDGRRHQIFERAVDFVASYPQVTKGLYLYGDMGIGKSFLMAALANELAKKGAGVTMLHYPTFVVDVKNAISSGSVKAELDAVKTAPVLILDDIGAESSTSWVRDEVLQVILQHRMLEELPTFFTSNYSLEDLEKKLAQGRQGDETWQAKRVLERIRAVATDSHLLGENRR